MGMVYSTMGTLTKLTSQFEIPSTELAFYRTSSQLLIVIIYMIRNKSEEEDGVESKRFIEMPFGKSRDQIPIVLGRGFLGALVAILEFYSMLALPLGDAITLFSLHPIITVFMAHIFLREEIKKAYIISAFATVIGAILMAGPSFLFAQQEMEDEAEGVDRLGYLTAILSSFCAAGVMTFLRKAGKMGVHTSQLFFSFTCNGVIVSLLLGSTLGLRVEGHWFTPPTARATLLIVGMCLVSFFAQLLLNYAGRLTPAGLGSIARSSVILWGYILEVLIFDEIPSMITLLGVGLIISALFTVSYEKYLDERNEKLLNESKGEESSSVDIGYNQMDDELPYEKGIQA